MKEFIKKVFSKLKKILMENDFKFLSSWAREFIGRTNELNIFKNLVTDDNPDKRIIAIHGIGGVGKTILLARFNAIANSLNAKMVISDNHQKSIIETMNKFADDFELLGIKLLSFQKEYKRFSKLNYEVLTDQNKPEKIFEWLGRGVAELGSVVSKMEPTAERIMQMGGKETIEYATKEISSYLYKKFSREDVNLLLTPTRLLTKVFVNNLKEITSTKKTFLCFDDYQETQFFLGDWLLNTLLPPLMRLNNVYLIISSQKELPDKWLKYIPIICQMPLSPFNREETESFLTQKGIKNKDDIDELFAITKGLPLSLQWQTISPIGVSDSFSGSNRYLISIPVNLRESVIMCTIPRHFNKDIIESLSPSLPAKEVFDFTIKLPGIYIKGDFWEFHEIIRKSLIDYKRKESPKEYIDYHQRVCTYYNDIVQTNIDKDSKFQYTNEWWELEIERLYHYLIIDEAVAIQQFYNLFACATAHWAEDTLNSLITLIKSVDIKSENMNTVNILIDSKLAIDKNNFPKAINALNFLSNLEKVPLEEKCIILRSLGTIYRKHMKNKLNQAEHKFKEVINQLPNHPSAYEGLAELYLDEEKYEKAIEIYRFMANTIKDSKISASYSIGQIYLKKGNYKNVENTVKELAKLSKDCIEQYALLAVMKEKQKAWDDAIEIHKLISQKFPKYSVEAKYNIARIYLSLEKTEEVHDLAKGLIKSHPNSPEGYHMMAAYYNMICDEKEELSMLYELSKRSLDLALPHLFQKSIEMGQSGQVDKIYKMLQDFEDISIEDNILVGNSYFWRLIGEKKKSITVLKRVLQQNPSSIISYCNFVI